MNLIEIFNKTNMNYEIHKKDKTFEYIEFENESIAIVIRNKTNVFKINRKDFFEIDNMLLPYIFILIDEKTKQKYIFKIKEPNNEIRNAFDSTQKEEIYFGKQILQNKITDQEIIEELKKIGS